jgi:soluble lytic murein transglycosylase-like protein
MALYVHCGYTYDIDPMIGAVIIDHESAGLENAIGPSGDDTGLMQVVPKYQPETQQELLNPWVNIKVGCRILNQWKSSKYTKDHYVAMYACGVGVHRRCVAFQRWVFKQVSKWDKYWKKKIK